MDSPIRWLPAIEPDEAALVGGKAQQLATLVRLGLLVPPAFVITTQAFSDALGPHRDELTRAPETVRAQLARAPSPALAAAIHEAVHALGAQAGAPRWLIARSSATFEDAADFSAAGQLESVICAPEPDAVLAAVRRCWLAMTREPLLTYLRLAGEQQAPSVAVVVQTLVETDVGGVLFTRGAAACEAVVIEAVWGLSHGVTGDLVQPARYLLDRATGRLLEVNEAPGPAQQTVVGADGSPQVVPAPDRAGRPLLTPAQLARLWEVARQLEDHFGAAQDVEWGFAGGELVLLQTRPVTAALGGDGDDAFTSEGGAPDVVWVSAFFEERFPHAVAPLTWSYLFPAIEQTALREPLQFVGVRDQARLPVTRLFRGRAYSNLAVYQMLYKFFPRFLLPDDAARFFPGGEVALRREAVEPTLPRLVRGVLQTMLTEGRWHPLNYRVWERFIPGYRRELAALACDLEADPGPAATLRLLERLRARTRDLLRIHRWSLNYAEVFTSLLNRLVARWTDLSPERVQTHVVRADDSPTMRNDRALRALAEQARTLGLAPEALPEEGPRAPELAALMRDFLAEFGHRSFCLDLRCPRYADDPAVVWAAVADLMTARGREDGVEPRDEARRALRDALYAQLRRGLHRWLPYRRWLLGGVLAMARRYVALREVQRFEWQRALHLMRRALVSLEARWIERGILRAPGDVFFLQWDEVRALLAGEDQPVAARASARRRAFRRVEYAPYPRFLRGDAPLPADDAPPSGDVLQGVAASAGQAVGTARVILEPGSLAELLARLGEEDVLVTRATDPGWTPAFGRVRALVMSLGGQLSHGAIVAREYGIPAVVGVGEAVTRIEDGARVLVDGDAGIVRLLPAEEPTVR